ncbi:hypothetical protein [uncultured Aquimarina sp.]|uniref:hypothetical protein n=1 Tax=uncultured Aquimarina sp. TaxID=575652 RepID=UPI0026155948|nr:hypothetical protein [uncultured Aquimarina sp.]
MDQEERNFTYADLQKGIDKLIHKFGVTKSAKLVNELLGYTSFRKNEKYKEQLIVAFITSESQQLFGCKGSLKENSKEFKDARIAAYHLIKEYTGLSYKQLGKRFGQSKRAVIHHYNKCEELLSIPEFHKKFVETYQILEGRTIQFIANIN